MFKWMNIAAFFENVCIYPGLKYKMLNFVLAVFESVGKKIYIWCPSHLKKEIKK